MQSTQGDTRVSAPPPVQWDCFKAPAEEEFRDGRNLMRAPRPRHAATRQPHSQRATALPASHRVHQPLSPPRRRCLLTRGGAVRRAWFNDLERGETRLGVAGKIMSAAEARACLEAGTAVGGGPCPCAPAHLSNDSPYGTNTGV
jgi:hypothetical protein